MTPQQLVDLTSKAAYLAAECAQAAMQAAAAATEVPRTLGDVLGHEFHGNQYTDGAGRTVYEDKSRTTVEKSGKSFIVRAPWGIRSFKTEADAHHWAKTMARTSTDVLRVPSAQQTGRHAEARAKATLLVLAMRALGDVPGHEFHGNQYKESKGTDKAENARMVKAAGVTIKAPEHLVDAAHEAVAHVVADRSSAAAMQGKTVEVKPLGSRHGTSTARTLYVDSKDLEQHGPGFTATAVHHELQHDILTKQGVPNAQQENRVRYTSGTWAGLKYGSMAKTNPKAAEGFKKAAREQGIKVLASNNRDDNAVHHAADAHLKPFRIAAQAALNAGRKAFGTSNVDAAAAAVKKSLKATMPKLLAATYVAGGAATQVPKRRSAGDVAGHEFHGNQYTADVSGESATFKSPNGMLEAKIKDGVMTVRESAVSESARGKGEGKALYTSALNYARLNNLKIQSSHAVSVSADRVWQSLAKAGHGVVRAKETELDTTLNKHYVVSDHPSGLKIRTGEPVWRSAEFRILAPKATYNFHASNEDAAKWAEEHAGEMIDGVEQSTRDALGAAIASNQRGDTSLKDLLDSIESIFGADRADLISRTESMTAANEGNRQSIANAIDSGLLPDGTRRVWIATSDCCDDCGDLDGEETDADGYYPGDGDDGPPLHPNCRCTEGVAGGE